MRALNWGNKCFIFQLLMCCSACFTVFWAFVWQHYADICVVYFEWKVHENTIRGL